MAPNLSTSTPASSGVNLVTSGESGGNRVSTTEALSPRIGVELRIERIVSAFFGRSNRSLSVLNKRADRLRNTILANQSVTEENPSEESRQDEVLSEQPIELQRLNGNVHPPPVSRPRSESELSRETNSDIECPTEDRASLAARQPSRRIRPTRRQPQQQIRPPFLARFFLPTE